MNNQQHTLVSGWMEACEGFALPVNCVLKSALHCVTDLEAAYEPQSICTGLDCVLKVVSSSGLSTVWMILAQTVKVSSALLT